jgi:putative addiction module component (TIGR02574 family)
VLASGKGLREELKTIFSNELLSFSFLRKLIYQNLSYLIMVDTLIKQIEKLNKREKLLFVEALWDSIASEPENVPLPDHHKTVLDERLKTLDEDTERGESWDEFRKNYL